MGHSLASSISAVAAKGMGDVDVMKTGEQFAISQLHSLQSKILLICTEMLSQRCVIFVHFR